MKSKSKKRNKKKIIKAFPIVISLIFLIFGMASAMVLVNTSSDIRQQASTGAYGGCGWAEHNQYQCFTFNECVKCDNGRMIRNQDSNNCRGMPCDSKARECTTPSGDKIPNGGHACYNSTDCTVCDGGILKTEHDKSKCTGSCGVKPTPKPTEKPTPTKKPKLSPTDKPGVGGVSPVPNPSIDQINTASESAEVPPKEEATASSDASNEEKTKKYCSLPMLIKCISKLKFCKADIDGGSCKEIIDTKVIANRCTSKGVSCVDNQTLQVCPSILHTPIKINCGPAGQCDSSRNKCVIACDGGTIMNKTEEANLCDKSKPLSGSLVCCEVLKNNITPSPSTSPTITPKPIQSCDPSKSYLSAGQDGSGGDRCCGGTGGTSAGSECKSGVCSASEGNFGVCTGGSNRPVSNPPVSGSGGTSNPFDTEWKIVNAYDGSHDGIDIVPNGYYDTESGVHDFIDVPVNLPPGRVVGNGNSWLSSDGTLIYHHVYFHTDGRAYASTLETFSPHVHIQYCPMGWSEDNTSSIDLGCGPMGNQQNADPCLVINCPADRGPSQYDRDLSF